MLRKELAHNTPEQVREYVRESIAVADEIGLSDADRAALLPSIVGLVSGKQITFEQVGNQFPLMQVPRG